MSARNVVLAAVVLAAVAGGGVYYLMNKPADAVAPVQAAPADAGDGAIGDGVIGAEAAAAEAETVIDAYAVEEGAAAEDAMAEDETIDESLGELVEGAEIATEEAVETGEEFIDVYESVGENFTAGAPPAEELVEDAETIEETAEYPQP